MNVFGNLRADVDDAQRVNHILCAVRIGKLAAFDEVTREVNVRAELSGELERLNQAVKHRIAPIKARLAQLNGTCGNARPIGAVVVQRVRQVDKLVIRPQFAEKIPQLITHVNHLVKFP